MLDIVNISKETAEEIMTKAKAGDADSQFELARMYFAGIHVPEDMRKAAYWSRTAAVQGDSHAMVDYAYHLERGLGVKQNSKLARLWNIAAAALNDVVAQFNLGLFFNNGTGGEQDDKMATKYFRLAARQGHAGGQNSYGLNLVEGIGVQKQDIALGLEWLYKAMRQDYALAFYNLGALAENGEYVEQNSQLAYEYFIRAANLGDEDSKKLVREYKDEWMVPSSFLSEREA